MDTTLGIQEVCRRGQQMYDERLRGKLEPQHNGEFVVLDIETGEYELDKSQLAASNRAAAKNPAATLYAVQVGRRWVARIGSASQDGR